MPLSEFIKPSPAPGLENLEANLQDSIRETAAFYEYFTAGFGVFNSYPSM